MTRVAGCIDAPGAGDVSDPRKLWIEGWAYSPASSVVHVEIYLDDHLLATNRPNRSRPDVVERLDEPRAEHSGFALSVSTPAIPAGGGALLRVVAVLSDGTHEDLPSVAVRFWRVLGTIDVPDANTVLDGRGFRVWGWAYSWASPVARVDVFLGDRWLGRAGLGRPRPDVARALAAPDAVMSGFELHLANVPVPAVGDVQLWAAVTALDGTQEHLAPVAVRLRPVPETSPPWGVPNSKTAKQLRRVRLRPESEIRVLWSARGLDQGGSQLRMAELVQHLHDDGRFDNTVLSPTDGPLRPALEAAGATVHVGHRIPLDDAAAYEQSLALLGDWMNGRFDLVVGFTATSFPAVDLADRLGVPSILRLGEAESLRTVVAWLFGSLDPDVEQRARAAVAGASVVLSNSHAAVVTYRADGYTGRFVVLGTGVDVVAARADRAAHDREECRRRLAIKPGERVLLCAASLWGIKGQAVLVTALAHLHREHPQLTCVLIGHGDGSYRDGIASLVAHHGLTEVVRVLPFDGDLRPWWRAADVAVCPSETEALPAAVLEAMAYGLPVLSSRVGDLARVVDPGVTGWLANHSDLGAMIAGLECVARATPEELRRMSAAAEQKVAGAYDRAEVLARTAELFRAVIGGRYPTRADLKNASRSRR